MGPQYIYIVRAGWWGGGGGVVEWWWWVGGEVGVFLYLPIRRVPVAMATIVHYVHYNRLRVPFFRLWQRGVTRRNNNNIFFY